MTIKIVRGKHESHKELIMIHKEIEKKTKSYKVRLYHNST